MNRLMPLAAAALASTLMTAPAKADSDSLFTLDGGASLYLKALYFLGTNFSAQADPFASFDEERWLAELPVEAAPVALAGMSAYTDFVTPAEQVDAPEPPLPAPWIGAGWGQANTGHAGPADPYNIYTWNCHSATNLCTLTAPAGETRGPLLCNAQAQTTPAWHSASWGVFEFNEQDWTCIYNWGDACCWEAGDAPPDIRQGDGRTCAQWACGDQYGPTTQVLGAGQMVEIPGYAACVRETMTGVANNASVSSAQVNASMENAPANQASCLACCDRRGNMWNGSGWDQQNVRWDFIRNCRQVCNGMFGNGVTLGERHGSSTCVPSTTRWSWSSRYEQCRGCCLGGAQNGSYPAADVNACLAVCSRTF